MRACVWSGWEKSFKKVTNSRACVHLRWALICEAETYNYSYLIRMLFPVFVLFRLVCLFSFVFRKQHTLEDTNTINCSFRKCTRHHFWSLFRDYFFLFHELESSNIYPWHRGPTKDLTPWPCFHPVNVTIRCTELRNVVKQHLPGFCGITKSFYTGTLEW